MFSTPTEKIAAQTWQPVNVDKAVRILESHCERNNEQPRVNGVLQDRFSNRFAVDRRMGFINVNK